MMKKFLIALILFVEAFAAFSEGRKLYFIGTVKSESFPVDEFGGVGREENVWILQGKNKSEKRQLVFLNGKKKLRHLPTDAESARTCLRRNHGLAERSS